MKKKISIIVISLLITLSIGFYAYPKVKGLTDVRVGPTAAVSVACSADGKIVYVVHGNGVYKRTNGSKDWDKIY